MPKGKVNIETPARYNDFYDEWLEDTYSYSWKAPSPGSLRGKIRKFLEEYDVTASSLQRVLSVNAGSFTQFMTGKYKDPWAATQNGTYRAAAYFFHVDKLLGKDGIIHQLKATRANATNAGGAGAAAAGAASAGAAAGAKEKGLPDVSGVVDVADDSPVWLTPAEVRAKVSALKRARAFTNADLARAVLGDAFTQSRYQLVGKFLNTGGEFGGANQDVYAPMARFVEKCRVALGKPKSKKQLALEAETQPGRRVRPPRALVPIRPRSRGERRSLRTFPGVSLLPPLAFNPRPRRLSTPSDAFQLHPAVAGTTLSRSWATTRTGSTWRPLPRNCS